MSSLTARPVPRLPLFNTARSRRRSTLSRRASVILVDESCEQGRCNRSNRDRAPRHARRTQPPQILTVDRRKADIRNQSTVQTAFVNNLHNEPGSTSVLADCS